MHEQGDYLYIILGLGLTSFHCSWSLAKLEWRKQSLSDGNNWSYEIIFMSVVKHSGSLRHFLI